LNPARQTRSGPIHIKDVDVVRQGTHDRLRATVDDMEVFYDWPSAYEIAPRLEPFLGVALLSGMADDRPIVADASAHVSPQLLGQLETLQRLVKLWNPEAHFVQIDAETAVPTQRSEVVASTFSGGVDSFCTLVRCPDLTHLVYMNGFDRRSKDRWSSVSEEMTRRIEGFGKTPVLVDTNIQSYADQCGITMHYAGGSIFGGVLSYFAGRRGYVPSSSTYRDLKPWGTHPLLDILWSTEATEIIHEAIDLRRSEKTALIAQNPEIFAQMQVCWYGRVENCGDCPKCIRTMLALRVLGHDRGPFPDVDPMKRLARIKPTTDRNAAFCWDLMILARDHGHAEIEKAMFRLLRRYKIDRDIRSLVKNVIGKSTITRFQRMRGRPWVDIRLPLGDPDDLE